MTTPQRIRRFGPLTWGTLFIACALTLGFIGWLAFSAAYQGWKQRALVAQLHDASDGVRREALKELVHRGADPAPALIDLLDDPSAEIRAFASRELIWLRPVPREAIEPLLRALEDGNAEVRALAASALQAIGEHSKGSFAIADERIVQSLCVALNDDHRDVRVAAIRALGEFEPQSAEFEPALRACLADQDISIRMEAAWALALLDSANQDALIEAFIDGLQADELTNRKSAVYFLGELAPHSQATIVELAKLLDDPEAEVRSFVARTLGEIGPAAEPSVPALIAALRGDLDYVVQCDAAEALGRIGPAAKSAIPELRKIASDGGSLPGLAADAIQRIHQGEADDSSADEHLP